MKDKLVELITVGFSKCTKPHECYAQLDLEAFADYLIAHGVTVQTTPISYERLLWLARKMHSWIFLNCDNELDIYNKLGITEEENYVFGYGGRAEMPLPKAPKEVE